jgi:DNA-directed RNA polymerase I, II, and III subunit RPABC1|uniref:RNA polymerase subunit H/Rpb5 C-terminal domain-containing protein n=1 Tax=viral metagenome TaxID=1070528 RepID=A0A6C0K375_9ZZZZ
MDDPHHAMWEKALENLQLMMLNRGYVFLRKKDDVYLIYGNTDNQKIIVWCYEAEKLNIDGIKEFICVLEKDRYRHGIIIYQNTMTSSTKKVLDNLYKFCIELFLLKELQYDLTKFRYFCVHEKMNPEQAKQVREKFGTSLPNMLKTDVVSRYYHFQKNDVIRIVRRNGTITYRVVK